MSEIYSFVLYVACGGMISFKKNQILEFFFNFFITFFYVITAP